MSREQAIRYVGKLILQIIERFYFPSCENYESFERECASIQEDCGGYLLSCERLFLEGCFLASISDASENEWSFATEKFQLLFNEVPFYEIPKYIKRIERILLPNHPERAIEVFLKGSSFICLCNCYEKSNRSKLRAKENQRASRATLVSAARDILENAIASPNAQNLLQVFCNHASNSSVFDLFNWLKSIGRQDLLIQLHHRELESFLLHQDYWTLHQLYEQRGEYRKAIVLLYEVAVLSQHANISLNERIKALDQCIEDFKKIDSSVESFPYSDLCLPNLRHYLDLFLIEYETNQNISNPSDWDSMITSCQSKQQYDMVLILLQLKQERDPEAILSVWKLLIDSLFQTEEFDSGIQKIIETMVRLADETMIPLAGIVEYVMMKGYEDYKQLVINCGCSYDFIMKQLLQLLQMHHDESWRIQCAQLILEYSFIFYYS